MTAQKEMGSARLPQSLTEEIENIRQYFNSLLGK